MKTIRTIAIAIAALAFSAGIDAAPIPEELRQEGWFVGYILGGVESRDKRLGASADIGHWRTSHLDSVECLRILKFRIISVPQVKANIDFVKSHPK